MKTWTVAGLALLLLLPGAHGEEPSVSPAVRDVYTRLSARPEVRRALEFIHADDAHTLADQKAIVTIAAPTGKERARGEDYARRLRELGFKDVRIDGVGNVLATRPGVGNAGGRPRLLVAAHLDTVFPDEKIELHVNADGRLFAPGIADNARGLAALLSLARALDVGGIKTVGDIGLCANVGEEGLGDLLGVKTLFKEHPGEFDGFVGLDVDSTDGQSGNSITYLATGSHRFKFTFRGPGGHSFGAFGQPSAIHALGRAIARIDELDPPRNPKTTFTVGTVTGGTSVNTIAAEATMLVDLRSNSNEALLKLEADLLAAVERAVIDENRRWNSDKISVVTDMVGNRPGGAQPKDAPIVQAACAATEAIGRVPRLAEPSSVDANLPLSLGVPAINLGGGGREDFIHTRGEWFDPKDAWFGPQKLLLTVLGLVGVEGVSAPILQPKTESNSAAR